MIRFAFSITHSVHSMEVGVEGNRVDERKSNNQGIAIGQAGEREALTPRAAVEMKKRR